MIKSSRAFIHPGWCPAWRGCPCGTCRIACRLQWPRRGWCATLDGTGLKVGSYSLCRSSGLGTRRPSTVGLAPKFSERRSESEAQGFHAMPPRVAVSRQTPMWFCNSRGDPVSPENSQAVCQLLDFWDPAEGSSDCGQSTQVRQLDAKSRNLEGGEHCLVLLSRILCSIQNMDSLHFSLADSSSHCPNQEAEAAVFGRFSSGEWGATLPVTYKATYSSRGHKNPAANQGCLRKFCCCHK